MSRLFSLTLAARLRISALDALLVALLFDSYLFHQHPWRRSAIAARHVEHRRSDSRPSLVCSIQPSSEELPVAAGPPSALERRQRAIIAGRFGAQRRDQRELIGRTRRRSRRAA